MEENVEKFEKSVGENKEINGEKDLSEKSVKQGKSMETLASSSDKSAKQDKNSEILACSSARAAKQEQIHKILFNREVMWQEIIYDLINTEQLDPWDIDIVVLTDKYFERLREFEEADFFISGKVLLAAALLLRIKSEALLNKHLKSIDEILFGKKEEKKFSLERIELDEDIPALVPKSPMPRFKKVTLQELLQSLEKAIKTENRRIKKEISKKNVLREKSFSIPKKKFNIQNKIREIYEILIKHLEAEEKHRVTFTEIVIEKDEDKTVIFPPLLHLDHQRKVWLEQEEHFDEIHIWMRQTYLKHNPCPLETLRKEMEEELKKLDSKKRRRLQKINEDFENPLGDM